MVINDEDHIPQYQFEELQDNIILGDSLSALKKMPSACVDLVFMDPPYFLQLPKKKLVRWQVQTEVQGVNDEWDKFASFEDYDNFIRSMLVELQRIMKPSATIWVIATYHCLFRIGNIMQDLGFWILNDVIWVKTNPMPNWLGVRFTNATETMIWGLRQKGAKGYTFQKALAKELGIGSVGANVWMIPLCTGKERLKGPQGHRLHSTQKPAELLRRVLLTSTKEGDTVLDPVAGVGTTGFVAKTLDRHFIMVEINPVYVEAIQNRLQGANNTCPSGPPMLN
jgi:DNA modification methylase